MNEVISIDKIISHAVRRCGVTSPTLTPEQIDMAKNNLRFTLMDLHNRGIPIYRVESTFLGFKPYKWEYTLPQDVYDITNINWRRVSFLPSLATGGIDPEFLGMQDWNTWGETTDKFTLTTSQVFFYDGYGLCFKGNQTVSFDIENSIDGINWNIIKSYPLALYEDGQWIWEELGTPTEGNQIRLTLKNGDKISLRFWQITQPTSSFEQVVTRMNRDDFFSQPQKGIIGSPWNWYLQKTVDPVLMLWQSPAESNVFSWIYHIYYIKAPNFDKLSLPSNIQVPLWFVDGIIWKLASRMAWELPQIDRANINLLEQKAEQALNETEASNSDLSGTSLIGNVLSAYTR